MTVYVFTGPTLAPGEASQILEAVYLPPAAQGDVYRVALQRPQAIGIIDGYFDRIPSVWHKEILWAMAEGIHVFGSASMGALRAAELAQFGMEGVGAIFEAYTTGEWEDDDEVAVAHGPAETQYKVLSVALVNIRATLAAAEAQSIICATTHDTLIQIAKALFYPERLYPRLLAEATARGLPQAELDALRAWLPLGQIDQKRLDALAMLERIRQQLEAGLRPKRVQYHFETTVFWDRARISAQSVGSRDGWGDHGMVDAILDEARLDPDLYQRAKQATLTRVLAQTVATSQGHAVGADRLRQMTEVFRHERGLTQAAEAQKWLADHNLDEAAFARLMRDEAFRRWAAEWVTPDMTLHLVDELRLSGHYLALRDRAAAKLTALAAAGLVDVSLAELGLTRQNLIQWFFVTRHGGVVPSDITRYAREAGFNGEDIFLRALLREYCYMIYLHNRTGGSDHGRETQDDTKEANPKAEDHSRDTHARGRWSLVRHPASGA